MSQPPEHQPGNPDHVGYPGEITILTNQERAEFEQWLRDLDEQGFNQDLSTCRKAA